jgi:2-polyprenyl-3-methyl-5-hydroxy-6-metoxy-1,4-benzoquinol methylase
VETGRCLSCSARSFSPLDPAIRIRITVVEVSGRAREAAGRVSIEHRPGLDDVPDRSQDFVMASAVLAHVLRPAVIIRKLLGTLEPGGIFYARTPGARSGGG